LTAIVFRVSAAVDIHICAAVAFGAATSVVSNDFAGQGFGHKVVGKYRQAKDALRVSVSHMFKARRKSFNFILFSYRTWDVEFPLAAGD
jgi:hypothetical protein